MKKSLESPLLAIESEQSLAFNAILWVLSVHHCTAAPSKGTIVPRLINHIPGRALTTSVAADCLNPDPPREGN